MDVCIIEFVVVEVKVWFVELFSCVEVGEEIMIRCYGFLVVKLVFVVVKFLVE